MHPAPRTAELRLLHVEDSPDDAELVRLALVGAAQPCSLLRVEHEPAYVAALDAAVPDAVICDYNLPRFSAERALDILRERNLDIPFLIVSHHIGESAAVVAMQQGASDYLPKHDLGRLAKAIEKAIERAEARADRRAAQDALARSEAMKRSVLDSLEAAIAVLDGEGAIIAMNKAWTDFQGCTPGGLEGVVPGANYLGMLRSAAERGSECARATAHAIDTVASRRQALASVDYQVKGRNSRWYVARVTQLDGSDRGVVVSNFDITDRMMAHLALGEAHKRLQALSKRVLTVQEEERRILSGELHDDLGQSLAALKISLHRLLRDCVDSQRASLTQCLEIASDSVDRVRALAVDIRPPQLDQLGLGDAIASLVQRQSLATGLDIRCRYEAPDGARVPAEIESACYRIAQEAISNASRHARATRIDLRLEIASALLRMSIRDNGVGFDQEEASKGTFRTGHLGLIGMEERAQLAGGRVSIRSVPGGGTTVIGLFPVPAPAAPKAIQ